MGDQTLLYRAAGNAESQRSLDPPPLSSSRAIPRGINEPAVAFGPPGSNGELNVSVIVSQVPRDFSYVQFDLQTSVYIKHFVTNIKLNSIPFFPTELKHSAAQRKSEKLC